MFVAVSGRKSRDCEILEPRPSGHIVITSALLSSIQRQQATEDNVSYCCHWTSL